MSKFILVVSILVIACLFLSIGMYVGISVKATPQVVITMDNPKILDLAMNYHGIEECIYHKGDGTTEGYFYYYIGQRRMIRPKFQTRWAGVFNTGFREWYRERRVK